MENPMNMGYPHLGNLQIAKLVYNSNNYGLWYS